MLIKFFNTIFIKITFLLFSWYTPSQSNHLTNRSSRNQLLTFGSLKFFKTSRHDSKQASRILYFVVVWGPFVWSWPYFFIHAFINQSISNWRNCHMVRVFSFWNLNIVCSNIQCFFFVCQSVFEISLRINPGPPGPGSVVSMDPILESWPHFF